MKEFFAAPASGLPSELMALVAQLSAMHFFMNEVLAAPASGLPSLLTALVSQLSCAKAAPPANATTNPASMIFLSILFPREMVESPDLIPDDRSRQGKTEGKTAGTVAMGALTRSARPAPIRTRLRSGCRAYGRSCTGGTIPPT